MTLARSPASTTGPPRDLEDHAIGEVWFRRFLSTAPLFLVFPNETDDHRNVSPNARFLSFDLQRVPDVESWLLTAPHVPDGGVSFARELAERLRSLGLSLWRSSFSLPTKHPEVLWRSVQWHDGEGVRTIEREHRVARMDYFKSSPVAMLVEGAAPIRVRLEGGRDLRFPICRDLAAQGGTDYYAQGLPFTNGEISYVSWATRAPGGFDEQTLQALDSLSGALARRLEIESAYYASATLLEVYLGRNAARRVLAGQFHRGTGELLRAAIWFCDLRGFTAISDRNPPARVVEMLDAYFDGVAGAITDAGGEVLKFIGDAILAIFPIVDDAALACERALSAAETGLLAVEQLNRERPGQPQLAMGVGLHVGEVMYGNVGSRDRLDFTVISSAVNEASRLEGLCKGLGTPLTLSEAFVAVLNRRDIADLGAQTLKGVSSKLRVFTLERLRPA